MPDTSPAQLRAVAAYRARREADGYRHRRILVHDDDWQYLRQMAQQMRDNREAQKTGLDCFANPWE